MGIHEGGLQKGEDKVFEKKLSKEEKKVPPAPDARPRPAASPSRRPQP